MGEKKKQQTKSFSAVFLSFFLFFPISPNEKQSEKPI